jgi:hypothetical protein
VHVKIKHEDSAYFVCYSCHGPDEL